MARVIATWFRRFAEWIDPPASDVVTLTVPKDSIYQRAVELAKAADGRFLEDYGEAKRHHVLAQLAKDFDGVSHRLFAQAIEAALTEIR